ncbi:MAG: hypothetical protein IIT59_06140, partial [Rhodocyclaceae bacterium]|nr:hypothetical protein [Rhodocyclaceae bacterium]
MSLDLWWFAYIALGAFVGFMAGMLGIGGGGILVPMLTIIFTHQGFPASGNVHMALGTSLHSAELATGLANFAGGMTGCVLIGLAVYLTYRFAHRLLEPLGETGIIVFLRMSAFILLCLGVQIMWTGASAL